MNDEPRTMTVRVVLSVEVDRDDWELNYGSDSAATIREDVKQAAADGINAVLANGIRNVEVK